MTRRFELGRRRWLPLLALIAFALAACQTGARRTSDVPPARDAEAMSLLGEPLFAPPDTAEMLGAVGANSREEMVDALIAAGRERAGKWRYRDAVEIYTRAMELAPDDPRLYRHRGHRYISLRQLDSAVRDLDRAGALDSTSFDIAYHQGLAHYLLGHFERAADVYGRCMAQGEMRARRAVPGDTSAADPRLCSDIAVDDDALVAITDWRYRALRRAGRHAEASALLEPIRDGLRVRENVSYYENLRRYAGRITEAQVMAEAGADSVRLATSGYAMANFRLVQGDTAGASAILHDVARSRHWPAFGVIAAEADIARLSGNPPRR